MNVRCLFLFILISLSCLFVGCKKNYSNNSDNNTVHPIKQFNISGTINLPSSIPINFTGFKIQTAINSSNLNGNNYTVKSFDSLATTIFVLNKDDGIVLMGYHIPGATDNTISIESTAIAIIMNSPSVMFLSLTGKQQLINNLRKEAAFTLLKQVIQTSISNNTALLDTNNKSLISALDVLFKASLLNGASINPGLKTNSSSDPGTDDPILYNQNEKTLTFANPGDKIYSTSAGVYKDNILQTTPFLQIEGRDLLPNSIIEAFQGKGTALGGNDNKPLTYIMKGDGEYKVKIRTGFPFTHDESAEFKSARTTNLTYLAKKILSTFLPVNLGGTVGCVSDIINTIVGATTDILEGINSKDYYQIFRSTAKITIEHVDEITKCQGIAVTIDEIYFKNVLKIYDIIGRVGNAGNLSAFVLQWSIAKPAFDTCYVIKQSTITHCCGTISDGTFKDPRDGQLYTIKQFGQQTWMTQNLNFATPNSSCYDNSSNNCSIYGKLYGPSELSILAPPGWHVATLDDWLKLAKFLGDSPQNLPNNNPIPSLENYYSTYNYPVVGGQMKNSCDNLWLAPNSGATNSSGFNALPGGFNENLGTVNYVAMGRLSYWYIPKISGNSYSASLSYSQTDLIIGVDNGYGYGQYPSYYIRCVKD